MTWDALDPAVRRAAGEVCTPAEREALQLYSHGLGYRLVGRRLGISRDAARARIENALRKIRSHLDKEAGDDPERSAAEPHRLQAAT